MHCHVSVPCVAAAAFGAEQLWVKLESRKWPFAIVAIDHAEKAPEIQGLPETGGKTAGVAQNLDAGRQQHGHCRRRDGVPELFHIEAGRLSLGGEATRMGRWPRGWWTSLGSSWNRARSRLRFW
jgi:hypothetical protein